MDAPVSLAPDAPQSPVQRDSNLPLQYYYVKQVIGSHDNKPVFMKKVLAVYPKGLKVVHATTSTRTVKELSVSPLLKFVDIREFQYLPEKSIFRFFYRSTPSNDPMPLATDLQYEFELALVAELRKSIELALERLVAKRKRVQRSRGKSSPIPTSTASPIPVKSSTETATTSSGIPASTI